MYEAIPDEQSVLRGLYINFTVTCPRLAQGGTRLIKRESTPRVQLSPCLRSIFARFELAILPRVQTNTYLCPRQHYRRLPLLLTS